MGEGGGSGGEHKVCAACIRVCQTTHGTGLPLIVPRFLKTIPEYSTPSNKNCNLKIPAVYIREYIGMYSNETYILEDVTGFEWVVTFSSAALRDGWKAFAIDYQLEKGDQIMLGLLAMKRFSVNVFNKFGLEKVSTRQPLNRRSSTGTVIDKETELLPLVSKPMRRVAEDPPLNLVHSKATNRREKLNGSPQHDFQMPESNSFCSVLPAEASDQNENKVTKGILRSRGSFEWNLLHEQVDRDEAKTSVMNMSSEESEDSVQVLLAKAILAKAKQRRLKKRKMAFAGTSPVETRTEATYSEGIFRNEVSKIFEDKIRAMNLKSRNVGMASSGSAGLSSGDLIDSLKNDFAASHYDTGAVKSREDPKVSMNGNNDHDVEVSQVDVCHRRYEPQNQNEITDQLGVVKEISLPDHRQTEVRTQTKTARVEIEDDPMRRRVEIRQVGVLRSEPGGRDQPISVFQPALVKQEPSLSLGNNLGSAMAAARAHSHDNEKSANCGFATVAANHRFGAVTLVGPRTREYRNLKRDYMTSEDQEPPDAISPNSNAPSSLAGDNKLRESQKQAYEVAKAFSVNTKNPSALLLMRTRASKNTYTCFVSVECAEILPTVPAELILMDTDGVMRKVDWRPGLRYLYGQGWKDFVETHNIQAGDVCVLEKTDMFEYKVLIHVFRSNDIERVSPAQAPAATPKFGASPGGKFRAEGKRDRRANSPLLPCTDKFRKCLTKAPTNGVEEGELPKSADVESAGVKRPGSFREREGAARRGSAGQSLFATHAQIRKVAEAGTRSSPPSAVVDKQQEQQATPSQDARKHYVVQKLIDRRKSLQGLVFLVEINEEIMPLVGSKKKTKIGATQDERGRWWVPHHHFNFDFSSCYIE